MALENSSCIPNSSTVNVMQEYPTLASPPSMSAVPRASLVYIQLVCKCGCRKGGS